MQNLNLAIPWQSANLVLARNPVTYLDKEASWITKLTSLSYSNNHF